MSGSGLVIVSGIVAAYRTERMSVASVASCLGATGRVAIVSLSCRMVAILSHPQGHAARPITSDPTAFPFGRGGFVSVLLSASGARMPHTASSNLDNQDGKE